MMTLVTRGGAVATPTIPDTVGDISWEIRFLDPDVVELLDEVDAILCEAAHPRRRAPGPPANGCPQLRSRGAGGSCGVPTRWWQIPVHPVSAVQRSPPARSNPNSS